MRLMIVAGFSFLAGIFSTAHPAVAAISCYDCHGSSGSGDYRPVDASFRNISSGGLKGNHRTHMESGANPGTCTACHGNVGYTADHRNANITMAANINSSPATGTYSKGTDFPQTANPTPGTCSNINCHFETATPAWGSSAFVSSSDCTRCHGVDPGTGSHVKHRTYYGATTAACVKCHPDHASEGAPFAHATSAGKRDLHILFAASPNSGTGSYSGPLGDYLPSQSNAFGDCTYTYCHSPGTKNAADYIAPNQTATWGASLGVACTGCHKGDKASGDPMATGGHDKHVTTYGIDCIRCHDVTVTTSRTIGTIGNHVNKQVNIAFDSTTTAVIGTAKYNGTVTPMAKTPGTTFAQCTNVYCHSTVQGASGTGAPTHYGTPTWGASTVCSGCHREGSHGGTAADGSSAPIATGSHTRHLSYSYALGGSSIKCVVCHKWNPAKTLADSCNNCHGEYGKHVNAQVDVAFDSSFGAGVYDGTPKPGDAYGSCSDTYCHSNGTSVSTGTVPANSTVNWGTAGPLACDACHGNPPAYANGSPKKNSHVKHNFACNLCHSATTSDGTTISASGLGNHVNRSYNVVNGGAVTFTYTYSAGGGTCANASCHSDGTGVWSGTTVPAASTPSWGSSATCHSCHGADSAYNDYREAAPAYTDGTPKPNAHTYHTDKRTTPVGEIQCNHCHASVTASNTAIDGTTPGNHANGSYNVVGGGTYLDGDNTMNSTDVTVQLNYAASPGTSTCSNVSCHPVGVGKVRETSSVPWDSKYRCIDCHNIDMESTSTFHHAMRNYSSGYPLQAPYSSADGGLNAYARRCTMCHADHTVFSPEQNTSNNIGRAANLRTDITVAPTASSGYTNRDFLKSSGGICVSCHSSARKKDTTRRRNDYPANTTPPITLGNYSASGHQYDVPAKFMSDGSTVYGNCSKCHNALLGETSVFMNATSIYSFGNHNSGIRRLQGALDAAGGETAEEQICYRCHSLITDQDPGGGPPKVLADKDFYGVAPMSLAAQDIFAANKDFRPANPTYSSTNKLFFKPSAAESPAEPMPNQHNTGDAFAGGTWIGRSMSPWETTTAYETKSQVTNTTGTNYWRMVTFTSPAVYSTTTVPAGSWIINLYCRESSTAQNARIRYMVYKWNANDTLGATIIGKGTYATELATTAAPGSVRQIAVSVGAVTLNAGEKVSVDLELDTTSTYTTSYTASFYFGSHAPSDLTLPGNVNWSYADPGAAGYGHPTQHFAGVHLPSTKNESLAYIAQNKHVECVDCHNPHATRNGLHGDYGIATGGSSTTLVNSNKHWVPNQWVGEYVSLVSPTLGTTTPVALITANTATTLTTTPYSGTWVAPVAGDTYRIIANTNAVSQTQRGVPGASVTYSGAWSNGTYSFVEEATYEYQICFKCHAATDPTTNTMRYWNMTTASLGAARWTNIGLEFNPNNASYHPVLQPLPATGNRRLSAAALTGGWAPGEVMSCSDCHGRDTSTSATAQGPHGSTVKWLLTGKYQNWPFTSAAANGTASGGTLLIGTGTTTYPAENFCFNCHTWAAGGNGHTKSSGGHNRPCVNCHIRVPHGGKVPRLLTGANVPARYKPDGSGGAFSGSYLTSAQLPATGYMLATSISCSSVCGAKHTDNTTKAYSW